MSIGRRLLYLAALISCAVGMIWAASAMASKDPFGLRAGRGEIARPAYSLYGNRSGESIFDVGRVMPGDSGRGRVVIANGGRNPFRRVRLTQDHANLDGISNALQLQIFDRTAKRCLYPYTRLKTIRKGRRGAPRLQRCRGWRAFDTGRRLKETVVPGTNALTWRPGERHVIEVRWRLLRSSVNSDQNRRAQFRLRWRAYG